MEEKSFILIKRYPTLPEEVIVGNVVVKRKVVEKVKGITNVLGRIHEKYVLKGAFIEVRFDVNEIENQPEFWSEVTKPFVFVSEDRVKMYVGDKYWFLDSNKRNIIPYIIHSIYDYENNLKSNPNTKRFSTKQAAQKSIDETNKFVFVSEDGVNIYEGDEYWLLDDNEIKKIHNIIDYHINPKSNPNAKRFATLGAAQNYIKSIALGYGCTNRKRLFTTDDNVHIYEGDNYWLVNKSFEIIPEHPIDAQYGNPLPCKAFSTREAAQKYVDENKPLLITEDGVDIYKGMYFWEVLSKTYEICKVNPSSINTFIRIVSNCKDKDNCRKAFSTREAAQKYVENKKKILFTTEDGVDIYKGDGYWVLHTEYNDGLSFRKPFEIWKAFADNLNLTNLNLTNPYIKRFSTLEAAKDYVNLHKPKFSKMEIRYKLESARVVSYSNLREVSMSEVIDAFNYKDE